MRAAICYWRKEKMRVDITSIALIVLGVILGLVVATLMWQWIRGPFEPLHNYGDPVIENMETLNEDGFLRMIMQRCNRQSEPIIVEVVIAFHLEEPLTLATPSTNIVFTLPPGCTQTVVRYHLPSELTSAEWTLIGIDKALGSGNDRHFLSWQSQGFLISNG